MSLFPLFLKLEGKTAVVVGAGAIARPKIEQLLAAGARVRVIAATPTASQNDEFRSTIESLTTEGTVLLRPGQAAEHEGNLSWERKEFEIDDVIGAAIVIAATGEREVDRAVFRACREQRVLCNAVDDPEYCDFYTPAVVRRGDLQIAISTNGQSPALAQQIRQELEIRFDESWAKRVEVLGSERRRVLTTTAPGPERIAELHRHAREALKLEQRSDGLQTRGDRRDASANGANLTVKAS